jgi:hypothetical protein
MEKLSVHPSPATARPNGRRLTEAPRRRLDLGLLEAPPLGWAELALVTLLLAVGGAVLFAPQLLNGGFYSDDWVLAGGVSHPAAYGHESAVGFVVDQADARLTAAVYWLTTHGLFGLHAKPYLALALGLGVLLSAATYALLRELRVERLPAFAVALLALAFPPADTVRVWATPSLSQLALAAWSVGAILAIRAFAAAGRRRRALVAGSLACYALGLSITETVVPFVVLVSPLLYLAVAPLGTAARRWALDLGLAAVAAVLVVIFTSSAPEREVRGLAEWWDQGKRFADQSVTLFSHALAPSLHGVRWGVLAGALAIVAAAGVLAWTKRSPAARQARRWLAIAGIALVGIVAGYAVYLPADPYYFPLQEGLAGRVNIGVAVPFALLLVALVVLAALVLFNWVADARRVALTAAAAYAVVLLAAFGQDLRTDLHVWERSAKEQYSTLAAIEAAAPRPPRGAVIFNFGQAGVVTPGLPIFYATWELEGGLRATYDRSDLTGVPIVAGRGVYCRENEVVGSMVDTQEVLQRAPYGKAVFVDVAGGRADVVRSREQCNRIAGSYVPGPFALPDAPVPPDPT